MFAGMDLILGMKLFAAFNAAKSRFKRECEAEGVTASDPLKEPVSALITVAMAMGVVDVEQATSIATRFGSRHAAKNASSMKTTALALKGAADYARETSWKDAYKESASFDGPGSHIHFGMVLEDELQKAGIDWRELHWSQVFPAGADD